MNVAVDAVSWMTPPPGPAAVEGVGEAEGLAQPVEDHLLELGHRGAGGPEHPLGADAAGEQVTQDAGRGGVRGEVREEARVLPVRHAREQVRVEIGQHRVEGLGVLRRDPRESGGDLARLDLRQHRQLAHPIPVVRDPVHHPVALLPELLGRQVRCAHGPHASRGHG